MAIATGSIVAVHAVSTGLTQGQVSSQPPAIGVVTNGAAPWSVLWGQSGALQTTIPDIALDELLDATGADLSLKGKIVVIAGQNPAYRYLVAGLYRRQNSNGGSPTTVTIALLQNQVTGYFLEVLTSAITAITS